MRNFDDLSLLELLQEYKESGPIPFHMPGHKRSTDLAPYLEALGAGLDVTELPLFDDLHAPDGILKRSMELCADLFGARRSFFLVNGATAGLLAGIRAATKPGDTVLVARNCHKAVYHALELCALQPVYLLPPELPEFGCAGPIAPAAVSAALEAHPDIRLAVLASPTYEGVMSDVAAISALCHERTVPLFVDEAHGAHLALSEKFPPSALEEGADLVVHSFHKTLPSLTQTAVLHLQGDLIDETELARNLGMFQTSSPSYLLLASLDSCVRFVDTPWLCSTWLERLLGFREETATLQWLQILDGEKMGLRLDPSKLVIGTQRAGLPGPWLMERLRIEGVQLEMAMEGCAVAMTGMGDTAAGMARLASALLALDGSYGPPLQTVSLPKLPERERSAEAALRSPWELCGGDDAEGRVSAEYLWAYPPGAPLLVPGERLERALIDRVSLMAAAGVRLIASRGAPPESFAVLTRT